MSSLSLTATAGVITFNGLAGTNMPGNSGVQDAYGAGNQTYFHNGYTAQVDGFNFSDSFVMMVTPPNAKDPDGSSGTAWNGTDYLVAYNLTMSSSNATPFSVESIDLTSWGGDTFINLTGFKTDGSTVYTRIIDTTSKQSVANDFTTYALSGYSDLNRLVIATSISFIAIDNIKVTTASDVPEPASLAILGLGLAGIGAARRRRK